MRSFRPPPGWPMAAMYLTSEPRPINGPTDKISQQKYDSPSLEVLNLLEFSTFVAVEEVEATKPQSMVAVDLKSLTPSESNDCRPAHSMSCLVSSLVTCATPMHGNASTWLYSYEFREFYIMIFNQNAVCCWPDRPIYSPKALKPQLRQLAWHTQSYTCPGPWHHPRRPWVAFLPASRVSSRFTDANYQQIYIQLSSEYFSALLLIQPNLPFLVDAKHPHILWQHVIYLVLRVLRAEGFASLSLNFSFNCPGNTHDLILVPVFLASCWHFFGHLLPQESGWGKIQRHRAQPMLFELVKSKHGSQTVANQVVLWPGIQKQKP